MTAIRKILKKYAKNVDRTNAPLAGFMALEIEHPDDPGGERPMISFFFGGERMFVHF